MIFQSDYSPTLKSSGATSPWCKSSSAFPESQPSLDNDWADLDEFICTDVSLSLLLIRSLPKSSTHIHQGSIRAGFTSVRLERIPT